MATNTQPHEAPSREELTSGKIYAEIMNLIEDTQKKRVERQWHPLWVGAAIFGAGAALATALVGIMKTFL